MFEQMKKGFVSKFLVGGLLVIGTAIPVFAGTSESIIGAVSSIDETALTLKVLNDFVEVDTSNATIRVKGVKNATICGQKVNAGSISGINMSSKTISFGKLRSGVSVDVYVKVKDSELVAKKMIIRSESCNLCH